MDIVPTADIKLQIEKFRSSVEEVLLYTKKLEVTNKHEAKVSLNYIARARTLSEQINKTKLSMTKSHRDYVARINNLAKEFLEPLEKVENMILDKIDTWKIEFDETISDLEGETFDNQLDIMMSFETTDKLKSDEATAYECSEYSYVIEEIMKVPYEYLTVDKNKFDLAVKSGIRNIPGLNIIEKRVTKVRRRGHNLQLQAI